MIYLPDASECELLFVLECLRTQYQKFRSSVWVRKFDRDTKEKKFGSLGHRKIPKGAVYKLGDWHVLKEKPGQQANFSTRNFYDLHLDGKYICTYVYAYVLYVH